MPASYGKRELVLLPPGKPIVRETSKAAAAFEAYCLLGPSRSLQKLAEQFAQEHTKNVPTVLGTLKRWSVEHHWQARARAYDAEQFEERSRRLLEAQYKMDEEHALIGRHEALRAVAQIEELIKKGEFGATASVQLLKVATDLERIARRAATTRQEITGPYGRPVQVQSVAQTVDVRSMTDEELEQLRQLALALKACEEQEGREVEGSVGQAR